MLTYASIAAAMSSMVVSLPFAVALARRRSHGPTIPDCALMDMLLLHNVGTAMRCPTGVALQIDEDAVQDIQALLQGVCDEIESLHDTYLKARHT